MLLLALGLSLFLLVSAVFVVHMFSVGASDLPDLTVNLVLLHATTLPPFGLACMGLFAAAEVNAAAGRHAALLVSSYALLVRSHAPLRVV